MRITTIISKLIEEEKELQDCYGALRHHNDINSTSLIEAIQMLEVAINQLKDHPKTREEIEGKE